MTTPHLEPVAPAPPLARAPHPLLFTILIIPFGAMSGYVSVAMAFLATHNEASGLTVKDGAILIAAGMFPHIWKFFWAPVVDTTWRRKRWYLASCLLCALGITAMSAIPLTSANLHFLEVVIFLASLASTFLGMSLEGLMAHCTPPEQRGRVGGWFQAGNLGGSGLGGGAGLWMATHLPSPWMSGAVLGACFLAGATLIRLVPEAPPEHIEGGLTGAVKRVVVEFWHMIKGRAGILCAALCILPIGTGAASGVLAQSEVAAKWGVGEDTVSLVNGTLNGLVSALGCFVGGEICARIPSSRRVYAAVGLLMAFVAAGMAVIPLAPWSYTAGVLAYAFVTGLAYAAFTGFVLDAIGKGAAATKYNAFASLSNAPITYMGLVLAWAYEWSGWPRFFGATPPTPGPGSIATAPSGPFALETVGARGMLLTEAVAGILGLAALAGVFWFVRNMRSPRPTECPACTYDLRGLPATAGRCPECGVDLLAEAKVPSAS